MDEINDRLLKVKKSCKIASGVIDLSVIEDENSVKGGILLNPKLSWISCGPRITNLNNSNGSKKTGWTFGWTSGDKSIRVVCVEELPGSFAANPILLVGYESENGSSLCFYHSGCSRVLKAIHFNDKISSIVIVSKSNDAEEGLSELLRPWNGVVAVGTSVGKVYLVDVWWRSLERCVEDFRHKLYDEQRQSRLAEVTINDLENNIDCRNSSIRHGSSSLALWLNELTFEHGMKGTHPGLHNVLGRMPLEFLTVSSLKYFPQISTLAVGYNTSCFQLWDLSSLTLLYTSALLEAMLPVFSFSLLEPSDDPRYVCYLWSLHHSVDEDNIPFAGMYIISYNEKHQRQNSNQFFYKGFSSCSIRYQLDLGAEMTDVASGRIISCQSIHRSSSKAAALWLHSDFEETGVEEGTASLLSIVWEVWTPNQLNVYRKLTLFDLNQWYREYMPTSSDMEYSQFMAHFCLPDGQMLDAKVVPSSVKQFQALQPLDEHFYPTATSFDCLLLLHNQVMTCSHLGVQQEALEAMTEAGPSGLLLPARLYKQCTHAGVRPLLVDHPSSPSSLPSSEQRAYLLCVALEHEMTQFLRRCAADWADGSHAVAGCTLPGLLAWAWDRVQRYKKWLDRLCVPLFDYSGTALDTNDLGIFHHMICQLHRLRDLFCLVLEKYSNLIIRGNFEQQHMVINLVTAFYDSVFWCIRSKVLPEVNANEASINGCVPYFTDKIINATISRRAELHSLGKKLQDPPPAPGLLLIDAVIAQETGSKVTDQWEREGATTTLGKYPPPSVQSLLRTYLIRNVRPDVKHFIFTYFLIDVAHVLCCLGASESIKHKLLKYPTDFGLTESQSKIVEAFWCLDHKQYQTGVDLLLDSCINKEDLQVYQHRLVLSLLAAVGEHKLALHYLTSRRRTPTEPQDIRIEMTLLLVNDLIHEAFQLQRHHQSMSNELLTQFFKGCMEMNKLDVIFKLALNPAEEEAFMAFLDKTSHPQADDLRVLYLLSRSRYVEAIDMNERLHGAVGVRRGMGLTGSRNVSRSSGAPTTRDLIINSVSKSLPSITRDLADYCHREKHYSWKQVNRPTPLSVVVHTELSNDRLPFYKTSDSQLIQAAVSKTREIWAPLLATPAALKRKLQTTVEDTPFLRNPIHSKLNNSVTNMEEVRTGVRSRTDDEGSKIAKKARLEFSPSEGDARYESTLDKTVDMEITCPESSAVLHTPLVPRIVKQPLKETSTPQSILKARSGPNTPMTPARTKLSSPAVGRQIRFSLPQDESSSSSTKSEDELLGNEGDLLKPSLSPRKSIHDSFDLSSRLPTPSNARVLQKVLARSLRSSAHRLQFDEEEKLSAEVSQSEPSATAVTLLNKIVSPPTSEEAYFSFQSTSSGAENKSDNEVKINVCSGFNRSINNERSVSIQSSYSKIENKCDSEKTLNAFYGLEGNILEENAEDGQDKTCAEGYFENSEDDQDKTCTESYNENSEESVVIEKEVDSNETETPINLSETTFSEISPFNKQNQTSESIHMTLEYKGDTSSYSLQTGCGSLSQSLNRPDEILYGDDSSKNIKFENVKNYVQNLEVNTEEVQLNHELVKRTSLSVESEKHSDVQKVAVDTKDCIPEDTIQNSPLSQEIHSESVEIDERIKEGSSSLLADTSIPAHKKTKSCESFVEKLADGNVTIIQDSILASNEGLKSPQKDSEKHDVCNDVIEESILHETTQRSVRGSTPLPQILEELVKKGRISLSLPEIKNRVESNFIIEEQNPPESLLTSSKLEEIVSEDKDKPQEEIDNNSTTEMVNVSKNEEPPQTDACNISFKQKFVFGNQESLSAFAASRNLTFNIGTHHFGSSVEDPFEGDKLSSSKLDLFIKDKDGTEPRQEEDVEISNVNSRQSEYEISDEPKNSTEITHQIQIPETRSNVTEVLLEEKPNSEMNVENIFRTGVIPDNFSSDLPEDDQNHGLDFYVDTSGGNSSIKQFEGDATADFELKMSEGESVAEISCYGNNEVIPSEETGIKESVLQILKPVEYQVESNAAMEEISCYDQLDEKEVTEKEEDVDIYGDIDGDENEEYECNKRESLSEQDSEEVICLGSSSDEESPEKKVTSSTPCSRQLTPKVAKQQENFQNETLDYEMDEEEYEGAEENPNKSYSSESFDEDEQSEKFDEDSKIEKKNLYFSSDSDSDTSHHRRSWKQQRKQYDSSDSVSVDEDTVESPPFELIGQESCEKLVTIIEEAKNDPAESTSPKIETSETKLDDDIIKLAEERRQCRLETGSILDLRERRSKRYSSTSDLSKSKKMKLRRRSCSLHDFMSEFIKDTKSMSSTSSSQLSPQKVSEHLIECTKSQNNTKVSSDLTTDKLCIESSTKHEPSLITQTTLTPEFELSNSSITSSLLPETGSIISNRTSTSDSVLNVPKFVENPKRKGKSFLSRMSSLHDISEEISENPESFKSPQQDLKIPSLRRSLSSDQLAVASQINSPIKRSSSVCRWSDYAKAHRSEMTSDSTEISESSELDTHTKDLCQFELNNMENSKRKSNLRSLSSDDDKPSTKIIPSDEVEETVVEEVGGDIEHTDTLENKTYEGETNISQFTDLAHPRDCSRLERAQSEPSFLSQPSNVNRRSRRSSSSIKINEHHKKVFYRSSLRGKSFEPQKFEIINSDTESPAMTLIEDKEKQKYSIHKQVPKNEDNSKILDENITNNQIEFSAEPPETVETSKTIPSTTESRSKRGCSEPPSIENNFTKSRLRTRRSSSSDKIEKLHKLVLPRNLRKSRVSCFQPMEIIQSDEESFQKTSEQVNQDMESNSEYDQQNFQEILETPVTTKKRVRSKSQLKEPKKYDSEGEQELKESSPLVDQDPQISTKTTYDYPQPPKKRERAKNKAVKKLTDNKPNELLSSECYSGASGTQLNEENSPIQDGKTASKVHSKKTSRKVSKKTKQMVSIKDDDGQSEDEPLASFTKESENHKVEQQSAASNKKGVSKKKKTTSTVVYQNNEKETDNKRKDVTDDQTIENSVQKKKKLSSKDDSSTPMRLSRRKKLDLATPPKEQSDGENVESSLTESQADEVAKPTTKLTKEQELLMLDSPARRTRRSTSRMSDTEMLTPTKERPQRRTRRNSVMSDVGLSTPNKYAESEMSDASTEVNVRLFTPTRRSTRRTSISISTPTTPDLNPEEFLMQRRLTRHQHSQLQKSFELSFAESPKLSVLEKVPEESVEDNEASLTPSRSSKKNTKGTNSKTSKTKKSKK